MTPRHDKVIALVNAALDGVMRIEDFTTDELVSAAFTLTNRLVKATLDRGADVKGLRTVAQRVLLNCHDVGVH